MKKSNVKLLSYFARLLVVHKVCLSLNDSCPEKWWLRNGWRKQKASLVIWLRSISKSPCIFSQDKQILLFSEQLRKTKNIVIGFLFIVWKELLYTPSETSFWFERKRKWCTLLIDLNNALVVFVGISVCQRKFRFRKTEAATLYCTWNLF